MTLCRDGDSTGLPPMGITRCPGSHQLHSPGLLNGHRESTAGFMLSLGHVVMGPEAEQVLRIDRWSSRAGQEPGIKSYRWLRMHWVPGAKPGELVLAPGHLSAHAAVLQEEAARRVLSERLREVAGRGWVALYLPDVKAHLLQNVCCGDKEEYDC